jgi:hypothetical protein
MSPMILKMPFKLPVHSTGFPAGTKRAKGLPRLVLSTGSLVEWTSLINTAQPVLNSLARWFSFEAEPAAPLNKGQTLPRRSAEKLEPPFMNNCIQASFLSRLYSSNFSRNLSISFFCK